jgi:hypothetical protein
LPSIRYRQWVQSLPRVLGHGRHHTRLEQRDLNWPWRTPTAIVLMSLAIASRHLGLRHQARSGAYPHRVSDESAGQSRQLLVQQLKNSPPFRRTTRAVIQDRQAASESCSVRRYGPRQLRSRLEYSLASGYKTEACGECTCANATILSNVVLTRVGHTQCAGGDAAITGQGHPSRLCMLSAGALLILFRFYRCLVLQRVREVPITAHLTLHAQVRNQY